MLTRLALLVRNTRAHDMASSDDSESSARREYTKRFPRNTRCSRYPVPMLDFAAATRSACSILSSRAMRAISSPSSARMRLSVDASGEQTLHKVQTLLVGRVPLKLARHEKVVGRAKETLLVGGHLDDERGLIGRQFALFTNQLLHRTPLRPE